MKVTALKTHKITTKDKDLFTILGKYLPKLQDKSIVSVTSKIVSICEGQVVPMDQIDKDQLIEQESELYLPRDLNPYNVSFAITHDTLSASAGIDESNGNGYYILWPKNPQESANAIRLNLKQRFNLNHIGVIITDSRTTPMRWGVTAIAIAHSGFLPLKSYIGKPDIFGRPFVFEKLSIIDNLASSASLVMGEGSEQTPLAVIEDVPFVEFQDRNPTKVEISQLRISLEEDIYAPFLKSAPWKKGKQKKK